MRRRLGADVLLAIVLPVVAVLALLLLHPDRGRAAGEGTRRDSADLRVGDLPRRPARHRLRPARREHPRRRSGREGRRATSRSGSARRPHRCGSAPAACPRHRRASVRRWSPAPATSRPAWSQGGRSRRRWPRSTARPRWPTSGSPGSALTPPTTRCSSWSTRTPARPSPTSRSAHPTGSSTCPPCAASRLPATAACSSTSARSCRTAPSSRSRCTPAGAGSRRTSSTPTTSWVPGRPARTGCRPRPSRPPPTCCSV